MANFLINLGIMELFLWSSGHKQNDRLDIDLWIMSCRVLKRGMEFAMMDSFIQRAKEENIKEIYGYYYPTAKNEMVKDFYALHGFEKIKEDEAHNTTWKLLVSDYENKSHFIKIKGEE